jgi:putative hydrolase of the HAD superfamily
MVTFDFWQTLMADTAESNAAARALRLGGVRGALAAAGHRYDSAEVEAGDGRALTALDAIWRTDRDLLPDEQLRVVLDALDPGLSGKLGGDARAAVARAYAEPVLTHAPVVAPGAAEAIHALADRGLALGIVSNTGRTPGSTLRRLLARAGMLDRFRVASFSDEVGARKPSAVIFQRTLEGAGCPPAAAVHIGDDAVNDVGGARAFGMRALHYLPGGGAPADGAAAPLRHFAELPELLARLAGSGPPAGPGRAARRP